MTSVIHDPIKGAGIFNYCLPHFPIERIADTTLSTPIALT